MRVFFLHGQEGSPSGSKAQRLRTHYDVVAPAYSTGSMQASIPEAREALAAAGACDVLIGSSWGGAVAMELIREGRWSGPVVLFAPAFRLCAGVSDAASLRALPCHGRVAVVHGWDDDIVPVDDSIAFCHARPRSLLLLGAWDHRLGGALDEGVMEASVRWASAEA